MFKQKHAVVHFYTKSETLARGLFNRNNKWKFYQFDNDRLVCSRRLRYRFGFEKWIITKLWIICNKLFKD